MPQTDFGPHNIQQGNSAFFTVEFLDANGELTTPSGSSLSITYTNTSFASQTDVITLAPINFFFTGTWSSTSASLGLANWTIVATGLSSLSQTGIIRVVDI